MKVSIFSLLLLFRLISSEDSLPCRFKDGSFGKCVEIRNCKEYLEPLQKGNITVEDIPICDSVRRLVCCPRISAKSKKNFIFKISNS